MVCFYKKILVKISIMLIFIMEHPMSFFNLNEFKVTV